MNATITLREYLEKGKCFIVPDYQRGYVWGKIKAGEAVDSVTYIMNTLRDGFDAKNEIFIQGITVSESDKEILLIDGQQRTTFFYLLLKYLSCPEEFRIQYKIREESNKFMANYDSSQDIIEDENEEYQDIYFFKKTLRIIQEKTQDIQDRNSFLDYVLDNVRFLYIDIPEDKAVKVFSMMNGNKAEMKAEELIKAELLRLASMNHTDQSEISERGMYAEEWDNNLLRSRYAREWDKWLQWWNRNEVKNFFRSNHVMGLLISTCQSSGISSISFESFKRQFLSMSRPIDAKHVFDKLRRLQKRFEDAFNDPIVYNLVGAIIRVMDNENRMAFIKWYFSDSEKPSKDTLKNYYKLAFLGLTHQENLEFFKRTERGVEIFNTKFKDRYNELENNNLYIDNPEAAFRLLLRLNIDEDNVQVDGIGRKFDFSIWDRKDSRGRSLEHVYPKSKVYHKEEQEDGKELVKSGNDGIISLPVDDSYIDRDTCRYKDDIGNETVASEHCIGNLVLLYKDDNSTFNNISFEEKKELFFKIPKDEKDKKTKAIFKSRHLLHTIYKFANSEWKGEMIAKNKLLTLKEFKEYYGQK